MDRLVQNELTQEGLSMEGAQVDCWEIGQAVELPWAASAQAAAGGGSDRRVAWLARTIETEIIPRLMLAHRAAPRAPTGSIAGLGVPRQEQVAEFARLTLAPSAEASADYVRAMRASGIALEAIFLELLAPAARRLGAMWEADLCDFTEVTIGLWRLQQVVHEFSPAFQNDAECVVHNRRIMLAPAPGSQHTLGLLMVTEFFRRAGWDVWGDPQSSGDVLQAVRAEWFDVAGFSLGSEGHLDNLTTMIAELRKASLNPAVGVIVGGPVFVQFPDLVSRVGADATAADAPQAILQAETLASMRERRS